MHADVFHEYRMVKMLRLMNDINTESNNTTRRIIRGINVLSVKQRIVRVINFILKCEKMSVTLLYKYRRLFRPQSALRLSYQRAYYTY